MFKRITTGKSHKVNKVMVGTKHQEATNNKLEVNTGTIITIQSQVQKIQLKQIINLLHKVMVTNMCSKINTIPSWNKIPSPFINLQVPLIKRLLFKNMIELQKNKSIKSKAVVDKDQTNIKTHQIHCINKKPTMTQSHV